VQTLLCNVGAALLDSRYADGLADAEVVYHDAGVCCNDIAHCRFVQFCKIIQGIASFNLVGKGAGRAWKHIVHLKKSCTSGYASVIIKVFNI
jgi:hypothetical protein